jgi:hypothetical protein
MNDPHDDTPDDLLERQQAKQALAIQHLRFRWAMGCLCSICRAADQHKPELVTFHPHEQIALMAERNERRPPGGFRAALRAHRQQLNDRDRQGQG